MKSIRKTRVGTLLTAAVFLAAGAGLSSAYATDEPAVAESRHHGFEREHLFRKLNLTTEQQASIQAILSTARPQMTSLHRQMRANHLKLQQTRPDDPDYGNVVAEVAQADATLASQRTSQGAELRAQMYAVLTPAQKTQLAALQARPAI